MIPGVVGTESRALRDRFQRWFDRSAGADLAPASLVDRLQPTGWAPFGYLALAAGLAVAIYGLSEIPVGPAHFVLTLVALALAAVAVVYPACGIVLVIGAVLIMPPSTRVPGIGPISPNLLFSVATALGFLIRLLQARRSLAWSSLYFALTPLLVLHAAFALVGYGPRAPVFFQTFVQGTFPFAVTNTAQRSQSMLMLGLIGVVTAYTSRSLYLLVVEGFPSCWNPYPHYSGGLGPLRYGHTLYGDPATVLAWIANLMVALTFGLFAFARSWQSRVFFLITFLVSLLVAWMSLARGGMIGSAIAITVVSVLAWRAHRKVTTALGVTLALGVITFVSSCLPLIPHVQETMGIDLGRRDESRGAILVEGLSRFTGPNPLFSEEDIADAGDWGGMPNLLVGDGPGARRGYHSYVINSAVDYGLPFLGLVLLMLWLILRNGVRLVRATREADPLVRGAAIGLLAGAIVAVFQAVFDTTLRVAGYAMIFWYLRGIEASLLSSLTRDE
ncbi:MAG: hypothetical protein ACKVVP_14960 [Chloroflexota bacterium]